MPYLYKGPFSVEDGKDTKAQQWVKGKLYQDSEILVSAKRLKALIRLGYIKEVKTQKQKQKGI